MCLFLCLLAGGIKAYSFSRLMNTVTFSVGTTIHTSNRGTVSEVSKIAKASKSQRNRMWSKSKVKANYLGLSFEVRAKWLMWRAKHIFLSADCILNL